MLKRYLMKLARNRRGEPGNILLFVMVFGAISLTLIVVGVSGYALGEHRAARHRHNQAAAIMIAEAGVNYYRWHLAHNPTDYTDGTGQAGPYLHPYADRSGTVVGHYSLEISPPSASSTVITISSTGWLDAQAESKRTVRVKIGFHSLTDFAFVSNTQVWVGNSMIVRGALHSNSGIRFDGTSDAEVTSAVESYTCEPIHGNGCSGETKPGVWGQGGPQSFWKFPVIAHDFTAIANSLTNVKNQAQNGGLYLSASGKQGWRLEFKSNGTVTAYKVNTTDCHKGRDLNDDKDNWYCVDLKTTAGGTNYPLPANGYLFADDMVWVDGTVKGRVTLGNGAGKSVVINGNVLYAAKDGNNLLGIISAQDILLPFDSLDTLEIDAALIAASGAAKRYDYSGNSKKTALTSYGAVVSNGPWTWSYISNGGAVVDGYKRITANHDPHLTYNPPAGFPVESDYSVLSWEEVK